VPRIVYVATSQHYFAAIGTQISAENLDSYAWEVLAEIPHRAAVLISLGVAAAIPGTVVNQVMANRTSQTVRIGCAEGISVVTACTRRIGGEWIVTKVIMSDRADTESSSHCVSGRSCSA
jgi:2-methylaconitate cis-trans-isomerase PrpF